MGQPVMWYDKFKFVIEIDGIVRAAFQTCSELTAEAANIEYKEGGRLHPHNSPGTVTFPELTMTRGVADDFDLYNWFKDTYDAGAGTGLDTPDIYRTFDIVQLNRKGEEVERYTIYDAYCRAYSAGDWDNDADEKRIETVTVQPDRWERVPA
jgi:phage tail-like protein